MRGIMIVFTLFILNPGSIQAQSLELKDTISEMILLIDQGEVKQLFTEHTDLLDLKKLDENISKVQHILAMYPGFFEKKPIENKVYKVNLQKIKTYFLIIKQGTPKLFENNTLVVYRASEINPTLKFTKVENNWLLMIDDRLLELATILIGKSLLLELEMARVGS